LLYCAKSPKNRHVLIAKQIQGSRLLLGKTPTQRRLIPLKILASHVSWWIQHLGGLVAQMIVGPS
jgi:hypothetical protein